MHRYQRLQATRIRPHYVYRLCDKHGDLLYIGFTVDVEKRLRAHKKKSWWTDVASIRRTEPLTHRAAWQQEQDQIRTAPGKHNVTQLETANRGWQTRRRHQEDAHGAGRRCNASNCLPCRLPDEAAS